MDSYGKGGSGLQLTGCVIHDNPVVAWDDIRRAPRGKARRGARKEKRSCPVQ